MTDKSRRKSRASLLLDHPGTILILALALAALGGYFVSKLSLQSDLSALLPENYESVRALRRAGDKVGGYESLEILVQGNDFEAIRNYSAALVEDLKKNPMVSFVVFERDVDFYERHALLYIAYDELIEIRDRIQDRIDEAKLEVNPFFVDLEDEEDKPGEELSFEDFEEKYAVTDDQRFLINPEKTILVIKIFPAGTYRDIDFARKFYREIRSVVDARPPDTFGPGLFVEYGGNFKNKIDEYQVILRDVRSTAIIGLSAVFLLIMLHFRRVFVALYIGLPLVMSQLWTFGLAYLVIGALNTMTVFLFVVLFGMGIDFGIHMFSRYTEERRRGVGTRPALDTTIRKTGRALATTAVTTSCAFFSLMLADFKGFFEFGFIAGTGILFSMLSMILVAPAGILLFERRGLTPPERVRKTRLEGRREPVLFTRTALLAGVGFGIFSLILLPRMEFEYDFSNLRSNLPQSQAVKDKLGPIVKESNSPAVVLADNEQDLVELERLVREKIKTDPTPTIDKFRSIYTMLPDRQEEKLDLLSEIRDLMGGGLFDDLSATEKERAEKLLGFTEVERVEVRDLPGEVLRMFRGRDGSTGEFAYIYARVRLADARNALAFSEDVRNLRTPSGKLFHATNASIVFADMLTMMLREGRRAILITFLSVFVLVLLDLRSLKQALLVLTPLLLGILWLIGVMYLLRIKLNFYNMIIIPSIIGIGVDNGVHIFHRYKQEGPGSSVRVLRSTGRAVILSSLTTMVGFSGLVFAHHPGLNAIGVLALTGISLTLAAALVVLPAILQLLERRGVRVTKAP